MQGFHLGHVALTCLEALRDKGCPHPIGQRGSPWEFWEPLLLWGPPRRSLDIPVLLHLEWPLGHTLEDVVGNCGCASTLILCLAAWEPLSATFCYYLSKCKSRHLGT